MKRQIILGKFSVEMTEVTTGQDQVLGHVQMETGLDVSNVENMITLLMIVKT